LNNAAYAKLLVKGFAPAIRGDRELKHKDIWPLLGDKDAAAEIPNGGGRSV